MTHASNRFRHQFPKSSVGVLTSPRRTAWAIGLGRYWISRTNLTGNFTLLPALRRASSQFPTSRSRHRPHGLVANIARSRVACSRIGVIRRGARRRFRLGIPASWRVGQLARSTVVLPHPPSDSRGRERVPRWGGHNCPTVAITHHQRLRRRRSITAHTGIRGGPVRHRSRGRSRPRWRGAVARAGISALEPVGHARSLESKRLPAGHASSAVGATLA